MDIVPRDIPADDFRALIQTAQNDIDRAAAESTLRRDPLRLVLTALSSVLGVLGRSTIRWERAVADVISARNPLPDEERTALKAELIKAVEDGAFNGMRKEANRMVRTLDRRLAVRIGMSVGGSFVLGALAVVVVLVVGGLGPYSIQAESSAAWHELIKNNPDPRPALSLAEVKADRNGRRYYAGIALWLDPSHAPASEQ